MTYLTSHDSMYAFASSAIPVYDSAALSPRTRGIGICSNQLVARNSNNSLSNTSLFSSAPLTTRVTTHFRPQKPNQSFQASAESDASSPQEDATSKGFKGFGKVPEAKPIPESAIKRKAAAEKFDSMKQSGLPEYSIWVRREGDEKIWYPVGSMCVERSAKIADAIYNNEDQLLKGAYRLFPILQKHEGKFEYGYQNKEFPDEPIRIADRPGPPNAIQSFFDKLMNPRV